MWGKLSLRVQTAIAVLLPCVAVAVFTSWYFPQRLNAQAGVALERQARSIGLLAVANAAPTMRLIHDHLATNDELDAVFAGVRAGGNIEHAGALEVSKETTNTEEGVRSVVVRPTETRPRCGEIFRRASTRYRRWASARWSAASGCWRCAARRRTRTTKR
jgi:hypothetical protein